MGAGEGSHFGESCHIFLFCLYKWVATLISQTTDISFTTNDLKTPQLDLIFCSHPPAVQPLAESNKDRVRVHSTTWTAQVSDCGTPSLTSSLNQNNFPKRSTSGEKLISHEHSQYLAGGYRTLEEKKKHIEKETLKLVKTKWRWNTPGPFLFWLMWNQCGSLLHNSSSSLSDRIQRWRATASAREWVDFTQWSPNSKSSQQAGSHNLLTAPKRLPGSGSCQCSLWGATGHRSRSTAVRATFYKIEARRISIT